MGDKSLWHQYWTFWERHPRLFSQIGTIATLTSLALAIYSYFQPYDPRHPPSLAFLSKHIEIAPWFALLCVVALIGTTRYLVRRTYRRRIGTLEDDAKLNQNQITELRITADTYTDQISELHE